MAKCKAKTANGKQCKNEAIDGKDYCHIKAHREQVEPREGVGHRLPQATIEQIKADLCIYNSINYIAKRNEVSWDTVKRIEQEYSDTIEKYRDEKKVEFADKAWESIQDALKIGDKKLKLTLSRSDMIEQLIDKIIDKANNEDVSYREIKEDIRILSSLSDYSLRDLSTYIGTLIDKHELVTGNPTERNETGVTIIDDIE